MKLATSPRSFPFSNRTLLESVELLISRFWQQSESNHFPPDVRVWEGTKKEVREGALREEKQLLPLPAPPLYMESSPPPHLSLPVFSAPHSASLRPGSSLCVLLR